MRTSSASTGRLTAPGEPMQRQRLSRANTLSCREQFDPAGPLRDVWAGGEADEC